LSSQKSVSAIRLVAGIVGLTLVHLMLTKQASGQTGDTWRDKVSHSLPLLGHRNWILIVDSAYPLQTSPGVETVETNASQIEVTREVLRMVDHSIHVRPVVFMDAELPFVPESDAPGITNYRTDIASVLGSRQVTTLQHEQIIKNIDDAGKTFHILVLKTNLTVPYTSVFLRLDCKYWTTDAETRLRDAMKHGSGK
jgi:hypothetical protein